MDNNRNDNKDKRDSNEKRWSVESVVVELKRIIKTISIDKWFLIGVSGLVLVLCSDSCQGSDNTGEKALYGEGDGTEMAEGQQYNIGMSYAGNNAENSLDIYKSTLEDELEELLSAIDGAGKVQVMITLKNTSTKEVLMEEPYSESNVNESDGEGGSRDTSEISRDYHVVYEEADNGSSIPFVVSETSPKVEGVAVVAEGGDSALVKEKITGIIKALFGIEINKIAVGKMK